MERRGEAIFIIIILMFPCFSQETDDGGGGVQGILNDARGNYEGVGQKNMELKIFGGLVIDGFFSGTRPASDVTVPSKSVHIWTF